MDDNFMLVYWLILFPMIVRGGKGKAPDWVIYTIMGVLGLGVLVFLYYFVRYAIPAFYRKLKREYHEKEWLYK